MLLLAAINYNMNRQEQQQQARRACVGAGLPWCPSERTYSAYQQVV